MNGKYFKTVRITVPMLGILMSTSMLFGCGVASKEEAQELINETPVVDIVQNEVISENGDIEEASETVVKPFDWTEVGKLTDMPELRAALEKIIGVTGEAGSKQGSIYEDVDQNTTLGIAMSNEEFKELMLSEDYSLERSELAGILDESYTDTDDMYEWEKTAAIADNYFKLFLYDDEDVAKGEYNPYSEVTRAQAMTALMKATTPVTNIDEDKDFMAQVGVSPYNIYAQEVDQYAFLSAAGGDLDTESYYEAMTNAEAIYMVTQAIYSNEFRNYSDTKSKFSDLEVDESISASSNTEAFKQMKESGKVDSRIYAAYIIAENHSIFNDDMTESNWSDNVTKVEFVNYVTRALAGMNNSAANESTVDGEHDELEDDTGKVTNNSSNWDDIDMIDLYMRLCELRPGKITDHEYDFMDQPEMNVPKPARQMTKDDWWVYWGLSGGDSGNSGNSGSDPNKPLIVDENGNAVPTDCGPCEDCGGDCNKDRHTGNTYCGLDCLTPVG